MTKVCNKVNLDNGSIKGDLILIDNKLYLIEFAARLSGGSFCTFTIPLVYKYNLVENVINIALNQKPTLPPSPLTAKKYQCNRFCFLPEGKIRKISGLPAKNKNIVDFQIFAKEGDTIEKITNHTMRAGTVLTVANSAKESIKLAEDTLNNLRFEMVKKNDGVRN